MPGDLKRIPAVFYRNETGGEPVREWLRSLDRNDRKAIGEDIKTVEYGWPVGMPVCRPMGKGLYEVRSDLPTNRIVRVLFCITEGRMVLLNGFIKKSRRTPRPEFDQALKRKRNLEAKR